MNYHQPIMLQEILDGLDLKPQDFVVDCTLGGAGHSSKILEKIPQGYLVGIDKDDDALNFSAKRLENFLNKKLIKSDFKNFSKVLDNAGIEKVDKILIDLGVSSYQLDTAERGFSFRFDAKLDMRMDKTQQKSAWHIVNFYAKDALMDIFYQYAEEKFSRQIANAIIRNRKTKTIDTTFELKQIVEDAVPKKYLFRASVVQRIFQAIRIEVNDELTGLGEVLQSMIDRLNVGGRLAVLTFHSLEDRIVKTVFKDNATGCICPPGTPICICNHKQKVNILTKKPIIASPAEQNLNPRSTSAKLRIAIKI